MERRNRGYWIYPIGLILILLALDFPAVSAEVDNQTVQIELDATVTENRRSEQLANHSLATPTAPRVDSAQHQR